MGDCAAYLEKNQKIFAKKNVRRVFITSCENLDYGVEKFLEENDVEYKIVIYRKWCIRVPLLNDLGLSATIRFKINTKAMMRK